MLERVSEVIMIINAKRSNINKIPPSRCEHSRDSIINNSMQLQDLHSAKQTKPLPLLAFDACFSFFDPLCHEPIQTLKIIHL